MVWRTFLFYTALLAVLRAMGKRQVAQMEPSEFAVTMLVANLASISLEEPDTPVWIGLTAMATVLALERLLSWGSLRFLWLRKLLCGKPVILIDNGKVLRSSLKATRVTLDELSAHLRAQGVLDIGQVQFAVLETNGSVTVFPYPHLRPATAAEAGITAEKQELPYTVISDGRIMPHNLHLAGFDRAWLERFLRQRTLAPRDILLLTVTKSGITRLVSRNGDG